MGEITQKYINKYMKWLRFLKVRVYTLNILIAIYNLMFLADTELIIIVYCSAVMPFKLFLSYRRVSLH